MLPIKTVVIAKKRIYDAILTFMINESKLTEKIRAEIMIIIFLILDKDGDSIFFPPVCKEF